MQFYKVYQSSRWVGDQLVIRLAHRLAPGALSELNEKFGDIIRTGQIVQGTALRQEKNEPRFGICPGSSSRPHRQSFGRFRQLIDAINLAEVEIPRLEDTLATG